MFTKKPAAGGQVTTASFVDYKFEVGALYNPGSPSSAGTEINIKLPPGRSLVVFHFWNTDAANDASVQILGTNDASLADALWCIESGPTTVVHLTPGLPIKLVDSGYDTLKAQIKNGTGVATSVFCTVRVTSITE